MKRGQKVYVLCVVASVLSPVLATAKSIEVHMMRQFPNPILSADLDDRERSFFATAPDLDTVETQLRTWMKEKDNPLTHEIGVVFDSGQMRVVKRGQSASGPTSTTVDNATVSVTKDDLNLANASSTTTLVVTHNHPGGAPLSRGDVILAVGRGIQAIRAVAPYGTFVLECRSGQWGIDNLKVFDAYGKEGQAAWAKAVSSDPQWAQYKDYRPKNVEAPDMGQTFAEDGFLAKHFACKWLAAQSSSKIGYQYPNHNDDTALITDRLALYEQREARPSDKRAGFRTDFGLANQ